MIICPNCDSELPQLPGHCHSCNLTWETADGAYVFHPDLGGKQEDYNPERLNKHKEVEEKHFWFVLRRRLVAYLAKKFWKKTYKIMDVGSGTGNMVEFLIRNGYRDSWFGEASLNGLKFATESGIEHRIQFDIYRTPFKNSFQGLGCFDVIEHLENDAEVVQNLAKMLVPDGALIITVPALEWLWNIHDDTAGHKRRYTRSGIKELLEENGFSVLDSGYIFLTLIPLVLYRKFFIHSEKKSDEFGFKISPLINNIFLLLLQLELSISHYLKMPLGSSLYAVAKRNPQ